jgi:hypothetical protein
MESSRTNRLNEWRRLGKILPEDEDPEILAGRKAERFLNFIIQSNLKYKGANCFINKRVPSYTYKRKYEIDLIVLTRKQIHFIEVKNWSGEVYQDGENWIQIKRNGERIEHPDFVNHNSFKQKVVIEFLRENGIKIDKAYFIQKIIFMNNKLTIDPVISNNPNVVPHYKIQKYLNRQKGANWGERVLYSIVEICLAQEKSKIVLDGMFNSLSGNDIRKMKELFINLPTWDKLGLYGEKVINGDAIKMIINNRSYNLTRYASGSIFEFIWTRNKVAGLLKALVFNNSMGHTYIGGQKIPISTTDQVLFHKAGEEEPTRFDLGNIKYILKG